MSKRKVVRACKLCGQEAQLCRSHIVPEFMYEKSYGDTDTFVSVSTHPHFRPRHFQKGFREHLLCAECETQLSVYEKYTAELLKSIDAIKPRGNQIEIPFDYAKLKLFGISLLWRAHVSNRHEHKNFSMGPLAEDLRNLLIHGDPGKKETCPFALARHVGSISAQRVILPPTKVRMDGQTFVLMIALGYLWYFVSSRRSHAVPSDFPMVGYTDTLQIPILKTTDKKFIAWLLEVMPKEMLGIN